MEFKCMWATEPVSECPPVKELNRLRAEVKRLEEENRWMEEENRKLRDTSSAGQSPAPSPQGEGFGEVTV